VVSERGIWIGLGGWEGGRTDLDMVAKKVLVIKLDWGCKKWKRRAEGMGEVEQNQKMDVGWTRLILTSLTFLVVVRQYGMHKEIGGRIK